MQYTALSFLKQSSKSLVKVEKKAKTNKQNLFIILQKSVSLCIYNEISRISKHNGTKNNPPLIGTQSNKQGNKTYWNKIYELPLFKNISDQ